MLKARQGAARRARRCWTRCTSCCRRHEHSQAKGCQRSCAEQAAHYLLLLRQLATSAPGAKPLLCLLYPGAALRSCPARSGGPGGLSRGGRRTGSGQLAPAARGTRASSERGAGGKRPEEPPGPARPRRQAGTAEPPPPRRAHGHALPACPPSRGGTARDTYRAAEPAGGGGAPALAPTRSGQQEEAAVQQAGAGGPHHPSAGAAAAAGSASPAPAPAQSAAESARRQAFPPRPPPLKGSPLPRAPPPPRPGWRRLTLSSPPRSALPAKYPSPRHGQHEPWGRGAARGHLARPPAPAPARRPSGSAPHRDTGQHVHPRCFASAIPPPPRPSSGGSWALGGSLAGCWAQALSEEERKSPFPGGTRQPCLLHSPDLKASPASPQTGPCPSTPLRKQLFGHMKKGKRAGRKKLTKPKRTEKDEGCWKTETWIQPRLTHLGSCRCHNEDHQSSTGWGWALDIHGQSLGRDHLE